MKKLLYLFLIFSSCLGGCYSSGQVSSNNYGYNQGEVTYQTFYDQLQPYGNWIDYPGYGYVWQPNAGMDFRPYETDGHWVSTVDGWAWASDYSWGWAPFHYGRWLYEPALGWAWVPGYEWAPAWVTWGQYDNYYAWAPLAPGINISIGNTWRAPYNYWSFIPCNYIEYSNPHRYVVRNNFNSTVVNNITIINNYNSYDNKEYYHRGPDYRQVEQYTHRTISPLAIAPTQRPGAAKVSQSRFEVYRPAVATNYAANNNRSPMPARIKTINDVKINGDTRRSRGEAGSASNSGLNQSNAETGNFRNRPYNNGVSDGNNIRNSGNGSFDNRTGSPSAIDRVQRVERFRQNDASNNQISSPVQSQPQNNQQEDIGTPRVRRFPQRPQANQQNSNEGVVTPPQQSAEVNQRFRNQRLERMQQAGGDNQNGNYNRSLNAPVYQNRNNERSPNLPQQNNNFRVQQAAPEQRVMPSRPAAPERTVQSSGLQNGPQRNYRRGQ